MAGCSGCAKRREMIRQAASAAKRGQVGHAVKHMGTMAASAAKDIRRIARPMVRRIR